MLKLLTIIKKNFKILIRSKSSALIILLGPLLLILLVGSAFNTSTFSDITIGTYSGEYNDLTNSILTKLEDDSYKVIRLEDKERCIEGVKTSNVHICSIFPDNLNVNANEDIELYVDQSRVNLVFAIRGAITSIVAEKSTELSKDLTGIITSQLSKTNEEIKANRNSIANIKIANNKLRTDLSNVEGDIISMGVNFSEISIISDEIRKETLDLRNDFNGSRQINTIEDLSVALKAEVKQFEDLTSKKSDVLNKFSNLKSRISDSNLELQNIRDSDDSIIAKIEAIEVTDVDSIVSPIKTVTKPITREESHINFLFPTLIMMVVMFVSLLLSSITVIREKISRAYFRNYISPTSSVTFIFATYLTNILIVIIQLIIVLGVMISINPTLASTLANVSIALLLITTTFILLGMIVGYVFSSEETSTIGSISLGTILLFFSNTIIPLETLPPGIKQITNYNIFVVGESILRKIILFESTLKGISREIIILLSYIVIFILVITIIYRVSSEFYNIRKHMSGK
ncbi:MAG: hypothetical protein CMH64_00735 [Nanoarchaeota archaeon]|nr:hypothetical protein [Nanoarchaeota archaeon]